MRVSLLSRLADFSAKGSLMRSSASEHGLLFRHSRSGWLPDFCSADGGRVYWPTLTSALLRLRAGEPPLSELVLVTAHTSSCVDGWNVLLPSPVSWASAPPLVLRKYSVPPAAGSPLPPGVWDGQRVKPFRPKPNVSRP